jgi:protein TonB
MRELERRVTRLGCCLMDSDPEELSWARRNRAKSLGVSLLIQLLLLSAAVVVPLLAGEKLLARRMDAPYVHVFGVPKPLPTDAGERGNHGAKPDQPPKPIKGPLPIVQPVRIPERIVEFMEAPEIPRSGLPLGSRTGGPIGDPNGILGLPADSGDRGASLIAPKAPTTPRIIKRGGDVQAALLIHKVDPRYPPLARQMRLEGEVRLRAIIATDGTVRELQVESGHPLFFPETLAAVAQWRYRPTLLNGLPVEVDTVITVTFKLRRE